MKIAFFPVDGVGHINPMLALASTLMRQGHHCRFFLGSDKTESLIDQLPFTKESYEFCEYFPEEERGMAMSKDSMKGVIPPYEEQDERERRLPDILMFRIIKVLDTYPRALARLQEYSPDVIIHDNCLAIPAYAAYLMNIPVVSLCTLPSINHIGIFMGRKTDEEMLVTLEDYRNSTLLKRARDEFLQKYAFDIFEDAALVQPYLKNGLNICTGIKDFELDIPQVIKDNYEGYDNECVYVGPMLLTEEEGRVSKITDGPPPKHQWIDEPFPYDTLQKYKDQGKKIVYASFGTVAPSKFMWTWEGPPSKMFGAQSSGKEYCRTLWQRLFQVLGGKEDYIVVMASQSQDPDALQGFDIPTNFIIRRICPQLKVLEVADIFITHGGANSVMESISHNVPMLVLPFYADQFDNAKMVSQKGMGLHHHNALAECTSAVLEEDIARLMKDRASFVSVCERVHGNLKNAGGSEEASKHIEAYVNAFQGHEMVRSSSKRYEGYLQRCNACLLPSLDSVENILQIFDGAGKTKRQRAAY